MSDNWASEAAKKLKHRDADQAQEEAAMLEKRKLIEEQGPALWREVREHVKKLCSELNKEYGQEVAIVAQIRQPRELHVRFQHAGAVSDLHAECDISIASDTLKWSYEGPTARTEHSRKYILCPVSGIVAFRSGQTASSPQSIAKQMLDGLLKS